MKTKKLLIMLVATLVMLSMLPLGALSASALTVSDKVKEVGLTITEPVSGMDVNLAYSSVTVKHPMEYKVVGVNWYKYPDNKHMGIDSAADSYFIGGQTYTVRVDLAVKSGNSGWNFDYKGENTDYSGVKATVNGKEAKVTYRELNPDEKTISVMYTFEQIPVKEIVPGVLLSAPIAGETPPTAEQIRVGDSRSMQISSSEYNWYVWDGKGNDLGNGWSWVKPGEKFIAGKDYRVKIKLQAKDGFRFSMEKAHMLGEDKYVFGYVNGKQMSMKLDRLGVNDDGVVYNDQSVSFLYDFVSCEAQKLDSISLSGIQAPAEGQHPLYDLKITGENFTVVTDDAVSGGAKYGFFNGYCWSLGGNALTAESVFEKGKSYTLSFFIKAGDIYRFADWVTATSNVGFAEVVTLTDDPTLAMVSVIFAPCEGGVLNEINISDVRLPVMAETPDYDFTYCQGVHKGGVADEIVWYDLTEGKALSKSDTFVYGHKYELRVILASDKQVNGAEGKFEFAPHASLTVKVNGQKVDSVSAYNGEAEANRAQVAVQFDCQKAAVDQVKVSVDTPVEGKHPAQRVDIGGFEDFYQVLEYAFTDGDTGVALKSTDVFAGNKGYLFSIILKVKEGYCFNAETVATINKEVAGVFACTEDTIIIGLSLYADEMPYYFINFHPGEGSTGSMEEVKVKVGSVLTLPDCEFTAPEGKVFLGWSKDGTVEGIVSQSITVTEGISLTAMWESSDSHTHVYGAEFNGHDEFGHFKLCISPNCPQLGSWETKSTTPGDDMGHNWGNNTNCDTTCLDCGYVRTVNQAGEPLHFYEHACSEFCPNCGQQREVDSHTPGAAADCVHDQSCTVCGKILTAATGAHAPGAEPTCTESQKCTVCDAELQPAKGHSAGVEWIEDECGHHKLCGACDEKLDAGEHIDEDGDKACDVCGVKISAEGLGTGAIIGIVIGAVVLLGGGGFCLYWFVIRKKKLTK